MISDYEKCTSQYVVWMSRLDLAACNLNFLSNIQLTAFLMFFSLLVFPRLSLFFQSFAWKFDAIYM